MKPNFITTTVTIESVDIPSMSTMSASEYREFLESDGLSFVDHHDVLRSKVAGYPLATTPEQVDDLIEHLKSRRFEMLRSSRD